MARRILRSIVVVCLLSCLAFAPLAFAGDKTKPRQPKRIEEGKAIVVIGFDHRPRVMIVLGRTAHTYKPVRLQKTFTHRIIESVKKKNL